MIRRKLELSPRRSVRSLEKELDISETSTFIPALKRKGVYERFSRMEHPHTVVRLLLNG
jgi:hypothetical protein